MTLRAPAIAAIVAGALPAFCASASAAPWGPPALVAEGRFQGVVATARPDGATELVTGMPPALFVATPGAPPARRGLPPELPLGFHELARNPAGEAVIVGRGAAVRVGVRGPDGAVGPMTLMPEWVGEGNVGAAVGPDGTAVATWCQGGRGEPGFVEVSVRPPGGAFGPPVRLASETDGAAVQASVDAAGGIEVLFWLEGALVRFVRPPGGAFAARPERVMRADGGSFLFAAAPDG